MRHGDAMTLESVAKRAGVGIATVYRNFPTREDLVRHIMADIVEQALDDLEHILQHPPQNLTQANEVIQQLVSLIDGVGLNIVIPTLLNPDEAALSEGYAQARSRLLDMLLLVASQLKACGAVHPSIEAIDFYNGIARLVDHQARSAHGSLGSNHQDLLNIFLAGCRHGVSTGSPEGFPQ
ncbi:Transcriptional regulator, TetR family [Corynebacterium gerontici]|uniref:Transcriptional regulator, TetR family n=2 Tax=Corynebacterium gerontici TaxID=2079234 RepID=A0A3G6J0P6_9CORY|nr:Transcriptional regulator, TetR family [Corynebacterium gerontici]